MRVRLRFTIFVLAALVAGPALAQKDAAHDWPQPPRNLPHAEKGGPAANLNTLFEALKIAPNETTAKAIEDRIWAAWMMSDSDTCDLLMSRVKIATEAKNYDLAIKLLDAIIDIKPDYVEAWNERATVYYLKDDYAHSIADIAEVLAREPRHFGALTGLGLMLQELGDDKDALEAYRKALAVYPRMEHIPDMVKTLSEKVDGRDI